MLEKTLNDLAINFINYYDIFKYTIFVQYLNKHKFKKILCQYFNLKYCKFVIFIVVFKHTETHGGKSVWNSLAVPATVKSELHPV